MQTALRAAHSSAGWLIALRQTQRELVFASLLLIHKNVDLKDYSSFIPNTLNRSPLNLMTRRPMKHDTGSSYRTKNHKTTFTTLCNWVTSVAWLLVLLNFTSGIYWSAVFQFCGELRPQRNLIGPKPVKHSSSRVFTVRLLTVSDCVTSWSAAPLTSSHQIWVLWRQ